MGGASSVPENSIHEFTVKDSKGRDVDLSIYKGKVVLIVNVASKCGLTNSNYPKLTQLYEKYRAKGFEILAFPCNQFLYQEPASSEKVEEFACSRFNAAYSIFQKVRVNGPKTAPLYKFLKAKKSGFCGSRIKWNFTKFLVDKEGQVIARYGPSTSPLSIENGGVTTKGRAPSLLGPSADRSQACPSRFCSLATREGAIQKALDA